MNSRPTFVALLIATITLASCKAPTPQPISITEADKGDAVTMNVGQTIQVTLPTDPSTGYEWLLVSEGSPVLEFLMPSSFEQQGDNPGAGGLETFTFVGLQPGETWISMIYHRTFEPEIPAVQTFELQVLVSE
jgi:inhibitor of cysteine peptidase